MNIYYVAEFPYSDELYHYGIPGMRWYIRRFQNEDGSLTPAGRRRYGVNESGEMARRDKYERDRERLQKIETHRKQQAEFKENKKLAKLAKKHPEKLSAEQFEKVIKNTEFQKKYREIQKSMPKTQKDRLGEWITSTLGDVTKDVAKKAGAALADKLIKQLTTTNDEKELGVLKTLQGIEEAKRNIEQAKQAAVEAKNKTDDALDVRTEQLSSLKKDRELAEAQIALDKAKSKDNEEARKLKDKLDILRTKKALTDEETSAAKKKAEDAAKKRILQANPHEVMQKIITKTIKRQKGESLEAFRKRARSEKTQIEKDIEEYGEDYIWAILNSKGIV